MKKKTFLSVLLAALLMSFLAVPVFAQSTETLTLREDWRITSDLYLDVPADTTLIIDGEGKYHIYELGGRILNLGEGTVEFKEPTILYPEGASESCTTATSNQLMESRKAHRIQIDTNIKNGTVTADKQAALGGDSVTLTTTPDHGYTLSAFQVKGESGTNVEVQGNTFIMPAEKVIVTAVFQVKSQSGSSSGGSSTSNTTQTTVNPDGSTTTTQTNPSTGTVTETTKYTDGSTEVVVTEKDGTVTTTATDAAGNTTETVQKPDGSEKTTVTNKDGSSSVTSVSESGRVESTVKLSAAAVEAAEERADTVSLPIPPLPVEKDKTNAPSVTVDLPEGIAVKAEIPVKNVTPGTVAILVEEDGTETVIQTSLVTENGVAVTLSDGDTVKIADNSKSFADVAETYWGADAVAFASSRELLSGTGDTTFEPETPMTRAMIVTVLARMEGVDTSAGETWYEAGRNWAMENGVSDGSDMQGTLTREQLASMLYRYAGASAVSADWSGFTDQVSISAYAVDAMNWAIEKNLIYGTTSTTLEPQGQATRAQVAAILQRFMETL